MSTLLRVSFRRSRCLLPRATVCLPTSTNTGPENGQHRLWSSSSKNVDEPSGGGPESLMDRSDKSYFSRLYDKHSIKQQRDRILLAESFLQAATSQASDPRWFGPGRVPRDFRSYQALLTMHIWFLHKRLIMDTEDPHRAALIQEELFDIFWTDSTNRMRAHGVNEWLITKNLKTVQKYSFMHCFHYDHCYTELLDKPEERLAELKNLVLRHVLVLDPEENDKSILDHEDQATRIAWYIEAQYQNIIHDLPQHLFDQARVAWVDLPDFSGLKDANGKELGDNPIHMDDVLPGDWVRNIANDGSYYYWNLKTRKAQWERPV